jgi:hypothetical protein
VRGVLHTSGHFRPYSPECVEEEFSEVRVVLAQYPLPPLHSTRAMGFTLETAHCEGEYHGDKGT